MSILFRIGSSSRFLEIGTGAPTSTLDNGSAYLRTDGPPSLYLREGGAWVVSGGGAPSGAAGGNLAGTYPNPTIGSLTTGATTVSLLVGSGAPASSPANGSIYLRTDGPPSFYSREGGVWVAAGGGAPSGSAGGDLGGTYPNPTVASITGSGGIVALGGATLQFGSSLVSPVIKQAADSTASVVADNLTISAQDATHATLGTGGNLYLRAGTGPTARGRTEIQRGDGTILATFNPSGAVLFTATADAQLVTSSGDCTLGTTSAGGTMISKSETWQVRDRSNNEAFRIVPAPSGNTRMILVSGTNLTIEHNSTVRLKIDSTGIGAFGAAPVARQTVTGSKASGAALASLLSALAALGWITDSSSA